ncbi:MAG TPA: hypothetical protein VN783_00775, partial [Thermoanaerobaculia bacterium]|nr:hypothetical protein [Thermoanaerobaculia bacterium]
ASPLAILADQERAIAPHPTRQPLPPLLGDLPRLARRQPGRGFEDRFDLSLERSSVLACLPLQAIDKNRFEITDENLSHGATSTIAMLSN